MKINIAIKSISKIREINSIEYIIKNDIKTLNDLIINLVDIEIYKYENKKEVEVLSQDLITCFTMLTGRYY